MRKLVVLAALLAAACTTTPGEPGPGFSGTCRDDGLTTYAGQEATPEIGAEIMHKSGARVLRWVPKGAMITMEFSADRVTIYLDSNNRIERISCG